MLKYPITFEDFNGKTVTEHHYFNLTKSEMHHLEIVDGESFTTKLERIMAAQLVGSILNEFRNLIRIAYGVKTDDGTRFIKTAEVQDAFLQTAAYDAIFMELVTDDVKAAAFVKGVLPKFDEPTTLPVPAAYAAPKLAPPVA